MYSKLLKTCKVIYSKIFIISLTKSLIYYNDFNQNYYDNIKTNLIELSHLS